MFKRGTGIVTGELREPVESCHEPGQAKHLAITIFFIDYKQLRFYAVTQIR